MNTKPLAIFEMLEAVSRREKRDRDPLGIEAISILIGIYLRRLHKRKEQNDH